MKLREWALAAEVFSALAVFATLVILVIEVRAGNELTRIASFQDILTEYNDVRSLAIENPEIGNLLFESGSGSYPAWGTLEAYQLRLVLTNDFNAFNVAYLAYKAGILDELEWVRLSRVVCRENDSLPEEYKEEIYLRLTDDVVTFLESEC